MHLPRVLGYGLLLVSNVILAAGADVAYIKGSIADITADLQSIKDTANAINPVTDFAMYPAGMGNYKAVQTKLTALSTKAGTYSSQIQGSSVSSPTDIDEISNAIQVLGLQLIATLADIIGNAGAFATAPVAGQGISSSIGGFAGAFGVGHPSIHLTWLIH